MNLLITGAHGQLGSALQRLLADTDHDCTFIDKDSLDLGDEPRTHQYVSELRPDAIINCAAYTAVDKAEQETQLAVEVNRDAPEVLAKAANDIGARLIHFSTDYVYDNDVNRPLRETDATNPQSVYARTKLEGEKLALAACAKTTVIRTSWVYGLEGHNFVRTMVKLGAERENLSVVSDQIGAPTFADDLAKAAIALLNKPAETAVRIINYANLGVASWYDFARAIMESYELNCEVNPIRSEDYPTPAARPHYSVLDLQQAQKLGLPLRHWRDALADFVERDATTK